MQPLCETKRDALSYSSMVSVLRGLALREDRTVGTRVPIGNSCQHGASGLVDATGGLNGSVAMPGGATEFQFEVIVSPHRPPDVGVAPCPWIMLSFAL